MQTPAADPARGYRLEPAPYGPWPARAPAGTVTDDTRHKIVLMRALRSAASSECWPISSQALVHFSSWIRRRRSV